MYVACHDCTQSWWSQFKHFQDSFGCLSYTRQCPLASIILCVFEFTVNFNADLEDFSTSPQHLKSLSIGSKLPFLEVANIELV
jgi:hypothetical protein